MLNESNLGIVKPCSYFKVRNKRLIKIRKIDLKATETILVGILKYLRFEIYQDTKNNI